ncbi:TIGR01777 family oxidoreductase [Pseudohaliea rubra]|uniref:Cell division inhibitor n=1 Tax=Pseudohaliea rubra DSM 19751 TaxID=1265313 RepID=A0A095VQJ8_9GAMM|nr:TIGR01777 family oxidoreductase [Pseudohaliea rubra]KGE03630.1 Cell division inhibitor [Pseudohaliea rubra DSM 19751]
MHVLVTGGTGFIGSALVPRLCEDGHAVTIVSRGKHAAGAGVRYVQSLDEIADDTAIDGIINLAGASLNGKRWTDAYKQEMVSSRLETTAAVVALCRRLAQPPSVLVSASAIGYYGDRGSEPLDEDSGPGEGFSAALCRDWEAEALKAGEAGVRVCLARLGVVFDREGGAFVELSRPFRLGIANWVGSGHQYLSWVHRGDVVAAFAFLLEREDISGPINVTAPTPVTHRELCAAIRRKLTTLPGMPVPGVVMRVLLGEVADELLLAGQKVLPKRLGDAGFTFHYPEIDSALGQLLGRTREQAPGRQF